MKSTPRGWGSRVGGVCVWVAILVEVFAMGGEGAAGLLIAVMVTALLTVLRHPGQLSALTPLVHMAVLVPVALRWRSRWRPGGARLAADVSESA